MQLVSSQLRIKPFFDLLASIALRLRFRGLLCFGLVRCP
jgi:hypothetical protein